MRVEVEEGCHMFADEDKAYPAGASDRMPSVSDTGTPESAASASMERRDARRSEQDASPRRAAMMLLAHREHSRQELLRKLQPRFDRAELEDALSQLRDERLQSDQRFAQGFARERVLKGQGPQRIQAELLKRGISGSDADSALRALREEEGIDWVSRAREVLRKKFGSPQLPSEFADRARCLRFLQYRGFSAEQLSSLDDADFADLELRS